METVEFDDKTRFSIYIEELKEKHGFETFFETISWYYENETDLDMSDIAKNLNEKLIQRLEQEAIDSKMLKVNKKKISLW